VILRTTKNKVTKETTVAAPLSVLPSALPAYPDPASALARLRGFRAELHACCTRRPDALVELDDALLSVPGPVASLPHLSLEPAHRRGWGSTYAALADGRIDAERLRGLLARHPLDGGEPIYAVDVTCWPRCDAECSPSVACTTTLPPLGRPADRRRLGLPVDLPAQLRAGLLDRAGGRPPA
jgi:DDE superfamily endonuclease